MAAFGLLLQGLDGDVDRLGDGEVSFIGWRAGNDRGLVESWLIGDRAEGKQGLIAAWPDVTLGSMSLPTAESAHWSSDEFIRWIDRLDEGSASGDVNEWLGIRAAPQSRVYDSTLASHVRRAWAEVFLLLVGCAERYAAYGPWKAALDRANMRAFVIRALGAAGNDSWHPPALLRSILASLTLEPERADALAQRWRELPLGEILLLRHHKELIGGPLAMVLNYVPDGADAKLARRWLAVLPRLP